MWLLKLKGKISFEYLLHESGCDWSLIKIRRRNIWWSEEWTSCCKLTWFQQLFIYRLLAVQFADWNLEKYSSNVSYHRAVHILCSIGFLWYCHLKSKKIRWNQFFIQTFVHYSYGMALFVFVFHLELTHCTEM